MKRLIATLFITAIGVFHITQAAPPAPRNVAALDNDDTEENANPELDQAITDAKATLTMREAESDIFGLYQRPSFIPNAPTQKRPERKPTEPNKGPIIPPPTLAEALRACMNIITVDQDRGNVFFSCNGKTHEIGIGQEFSFIYDRGKNRANLPEELQKLNPNGEFKFRLKLLKIKDRTLRLEDLDEKKPFEILRR